MKFGKAAVMSDFWKTLDASISATPCRDTDVPWNKLTANDDCNESQENVHIMLCILQIKRKKIC